MSEILRQNYPIITGAPDRVSAKPVTKSVEGTQSFGQMLEVALGQNHQKTLTFSRHAQERTIQRGIDISHADMQRLDSAVGKAQDKGLTDTLVFMSGTAFIVNVPNRVVVTVVDGADKDNNVFTNIDGAVII